MIKIIGARVAFLSLEEPWVPRDKLGVGESKENGWTRNTGGPPEKTILVMTASACGADKIP
jgi:hypothetical protein